MTSGPLAGRVAIVTGSGRNIGRAIARRLAREGAAVVVNARANVAEADAVAAEIEAEGGRALPCIADVTDEQAVARMVAAAVERFGGLHILVNNAAVRHEAELQDMALEAWHAVLAVVLDGAFLCARAALPHLTASGGAIVNIGGLTGHTGAAGRAHVVAAKAGLAGFTKALAWELAPHDVTANLVVPGLIDTARTGSSVAPRPAHHAVHRTLVGRRGTPDEVAGIVATLCGPDGRYVTGQTIHVNGGTYLP